MFKMMLFEIIRDDGSERRSEPRNDGCERGGSRKVSFKH